MLIYCLQTPLADQEGPKVGTSSFFEVLSSREIAYHMTVYDWELFNCVHEVNDASFVSALDIRPLVMSCLPAVIGRGY